MKFKNFGYTELHEAGRLLQAYADNPIINIDGLRIECNPDSKNVYLENDENECAMLNKGKIEQVYSTPYHGHQGFLADLHEMDRTGWAQEDIDYINKLAIDFLNKILRSKNIKEVRVI